MNNGHGPCEDTCRNTIGGYECSCDGLQDTVLSADNHTCHDAGPCSVNNAGCSHTCLSTRGRVFCICPDGFILEDDWKTCQGNGICSTFTSLSVPLPCFSFESSVADRGNFNNLRRGRTVKNIELQRVPSELRRTSDSIIAFDSP